MPIGASRARLARRRVRRIGRYGSWWKRDLAFFLTASLVVALDQASKLLIRISLSPGQSVPGDAPVRLTYVTNTGGAFGLFANQTFLLILTAAVGVVALFLYYRYPPFDSPLLRTGLGLQFGGAVGNLVDRVRLGYVIDFVDLRVWPVFNLADSAIVVGVAIFACFLLFFSRREESELGKD